MKRYKFRDVGTHLKVTVNALDASDAVRKAEKIFNKRQKSKPNWEFLD